MSHRRDVVLMARAPEPGRTKTRLIPDLGEERVASLADAMLRDTLLLTAQDDSVQLHIAMDQQGDAAYFSAAAPEANLFPQRGETFGERLANAMCDITGPDNQVVALGTDCPHMPVKVLTTAWDRLAAGRCDVVLGPAADGGYYLIGWSHPYPEIIVPIEMSTPRVLTDTTEMAHRLGITVSLLDTHFDIDDIDDVRRLARLFAASTGGAEFSRSVLDRLRL
ncbi:MAG: TIGR04282 family arsenosugar biosynthesis glycosyltransferase [Actinomycetota bacterium]|nr:TIGR04282 family arsenosugar biosynthesis glycosyltransferase [Actinomycetota bacterium]